MPLNQSSYNALFISQQALVDNGVIDDNVDTQVIMPVIKLVQDKWIQEILGTPFMVDLQNKVVSGSLNSDEQGFLKMYLEPCMIWYSAYEVSFLNSYKIKVKGLEKMSGENSQVASLSEIQAYQNKAKEDAEFYAQRAVRYLESYPNLFPMYYNAGFLIADLMPNKRSGYQSSMYLGRDRGYTDYGRRNGGEGYGERFFENY